MIIKKFHLKVTALVLSLIALSPNSELFGSCGERRHHDRHHQEDVTGVTPAQAIYQDETSFSPVSGQPISFSVKGFKTNVGITSNKSVFEIEVPGLYSIDSFLLADVPNVGDSVAGYLTINDRQLLPFFSRETRLLSPIVELHFNDRLVYLDKGDRVSVVLTEFAPGTTILSRGFVLIALNNSRSN